MLRFVVVMQSFIMNSHEVFIHIHQGCFAGTGAIVRLPQCQWSKPDGYGKISQCITTTMHSKAKTVCIYLGIYCSLSSYISLYALSFGVKCRSNPPLAHALRYFRQNQYTVWIFSKRQRSYSNVDLGTIFDLWMSYIVRWISMSFV